MSAQDEDNTEGYSMQELQNSSKRRKTAAACSACKSRKSRCELVTSAGCRRCCVLGTVCSFRTMNGLPDRESEESQTWASRTLPGSRATSPIRESSQAEARPPSRRESHIHRSSLASGSATTFKLQNDANPVAADHTLEDVRKRTQRLELMMELMLEQTSKSELAALKSSQERSRSPQESSDARKRNTDSSDDDHAFDREYATLEGFLPLAKLMKPGKVAWAKPVEALGLEDRWIEICAIFRQIFSGILPLPHIHRDAFYLESCPLLRSAILLFVSRTDPGLAIFSKYQQRLVNAIMERNMTSATRVKPTLSRVIALLILANLPPNTPGERIQPSEFQATPLIAMDMAQHLELDAAVHLLHEADPEGWHFMDPTGLLENLCLWFCIVHRLAWTNLHSSPTFLINVSQSNRPIHHLRYLDSIALSIPTVSTLWTLLREESSILEHSRNIGDDFARIRYARMYDQGQIDNFIINMKTYTGQLRDLRFRLEAQPYTALCPLWLDCCAAQIGLYFRFTHRFAFDLPLVLGPEPRQSNIIATGRVLIQACQDYSRYSYTTRLNHRHVPGFHLSIALLSLGPLLQGAAGDPPEHDEPGGSLCQEHFADVCRSVSRVHPMVASVIQRLRDPLAVTGRIRAFVEDGKTRQKAKSEADAMNADLYGMGMPSFPGGMGLEMFTDWVWPADCDWLSGMVAPDAETTSRVPDLSFGVP